MIGDSIGSFVARMSNYESTQEYFDEFEIYGEIFVVHHQVNDNKYFRVSHKNSGLAMPVNRESQRRLLYTKNPFIAKKEAIEYAESKGEEAFLIALEKAKAIQ